MDLAARLRERRKEIEGATLARVYGIHDPASVGDSQYVIGLRSAISAALSYGIESIDAPGGRPAPPPAELLTQARKAARNQVSLEIVLRRYVAGYTLLGDFIIREAGEVAMPASRLQKILRTESVLFDRVVAAVTEEYAREVKERSGCTEERRAERVRMLIAGELVDEIDFGYGLDAWHVGAVAVGPAVLTAMHRLATSLDYRLLSVRGDADTIWAWLGRNELPSTSEIMAVARSRWPAEAWLAIGEPGKGIEGWRFTHRQAKAAIAVALRKAPNATRYADVALLATAVDDEVLARSLHSLYLAPLENEPDGGVTLRKTLFEYFAAGRNLSSAAAALGITRQTVSARLRTVEKRIRRSVDACGTELKLAIYLGDLEASP